MSYIRSVSLEASIVGVAIVFVGTLVSFLISLVQDRNFDFLKNPEMYIALFTTGFVLHIVWDLVGLNRFYCKNCAGCN